MRKRSSVLFGLIVVLSLILSACVAPTPQASTGASSDSGSEATSEDTVTIRWWHIWGGAEASIADNWQKLADEYMEMHPNVKIEITVITNAFNDVLATNMQAGDPPDLFQTWGGGVLWQYADAGLVQDLTDALAEDGWGDTFLEAPMAVYRHNGKIYGVPWRFGMVGIWYNKALFEQAGIEEIPTTWTEFLSVVRQLKEAGITPIAIGERDRWTGHFWWSYLALRNAGQEGFLRAYTREGSFTDEPFIRAGEQLQELIALEPFQPGFLEATYADQQVVMGQEQAAMELMGQWAYGANVAVAEDHLESYMENVGWFPFPMVEGGAGSPTDAFGGGDGFAIGINAPPETIDFVKFLTSPEHQLAMAEAEIAILPVVHGAESAIEIPVLQTVQEHFSSAEFLQLYLDQFMPPAVGLAVNDYVQELFTATKSPVEVAEAIEEVAAQELGP